MIHCKFDFSIFDDIGMLFEYPKDELFPVVSSLIIKFSSIPKQDCKKITEKLQIFFDYCSSNNSGRLEEDFISTFEMNTKYVLYIGHLLFGENYERSNYISQLKGLYDDYGFVIENNELPDHITLIFRFLSKNNVPIDKKKQLINNLTDAFTQKTTSINKPEEIYLLSLDAENKYPVVYSVLIDFIELLKNLEID